MAVPGTFFIPVQMLAINALCRALRMSISNLRRLLGPLFCGRGRIAEQHFTKTKLAEEIFNQLPLCQ